MYLHLVKNIHFSVFICFDGSTELFNVSHPSNNQLRAFTAEKKNVCSSSGNSNVFAPIFPQRKDFLTSHISRGRKDRKKGQKSHFRIFNNRETSSKRIGIKNV